MTWIRRAEPTPVHKCDPPMREAWCTVPPTPPPSGGWQGRTPPGPKRMRLPDRPDGKRGDLWRCDDCSRLWRIDLPPITNRGGYVGGGLEWLPATWWQRMRYRGAPSTAAVSTPDAPMEDR